MTFARKVIEFNGNLEFKGTLPAGISIMNPFRENPVMNELSAEVLYKVLF